MRFWIEISIHSQGRLQSRLWWCCWTPLQGLKGLWSCVYFILLVPCRVFVGSAKGIRKDEVLLSPPPRTVIAVSPPSSGSSLRVSPSPAPCLHPHLQPPDLQRRYLLQCCHPLRRSFFVLLSLLLPLQVKASGLQLSRNHPPFAFTSLKTSTGQWKT